MNSSTPHGEELMLTNRTKVKNGFSLIELLIVVVVIGVIAAIAIPNLMASRRAANEGSAISDLRMYHSAQTTYATSLGRGNFAGSTTLNTDAFTELGAAGIIDSLIAGGAKSGYLFTGMKGDASGSTPASFCGRGVPIVPTGMTATGPRNIAVSTDGVIQTGSATILTSADCANVSGVASVTAGTPLGN